MIRRVVSFAVVFLASTSNATLNWPEKSTDVTDVRSKTYLRKLETSIKELKLEQQEEHHEVSNISNSNIKFDMCQYAELFSNDMNQAVSTGEVVTEANTRKSIARFVIFQFCSAGFDSCQDRNKQRMIDLNDYLQITVKYLKDEQEESCKVCNEKCDGVNFSKKNEVDCPRCTDECQHIEKMKDNGYIDATNFITCMKIRSDDKEPIYAGPMCGGDQGSKIKISVFKDEQCLSPDLSKSIEDYIADEEGHAFKLSLNLLKRTHSTNHPIACAKLDQEGATGIKEVCTSLYNASIKHE